MSDTLSLEESQAPSSLHCINLKEAWDINFWCDELNLQADDLMEIVKLVGPAVHDVRVYMAKRLILKWPLAY